MPVRIWVMGVGEQSSPFGGSVRWEYVERNEEVTRRALADLEDRRVLFSGGNSRHIRAMAMAYGVLLEDAVQAGFASARRRPRRRVVTDEVICHLADIGEKWRTNP